MNASSYGPIVSRALLTRELLKLRHSSGETQQEAAISLRWSLSKFIRVEGGSVRLSQADLEYLLRHYNVTDENLVKSLSDLAESGRQAGWWHNYNLPDDKAFVDYIGYESDATEIRMTEGANIPGLLQTEPYVRAIAAAYGANERRVEDIVALRRARQDRVAEHGTKQIYILDEAALRRKVSNVMPEQLRHLIRLAEKPNITILMIPFTAGPHYGMKGPFVILTFDSGLDDVLYLESARRGDLIIDPGGQSLQGHSEDVAAGQVQSVTRYREGFQSMIEVAKDPADSVEFFQSLIGEMS